MAFRRSSVWLWLVGGALAMCVAIGTANAVSLKSQASTTPAPLAFAEVSLATASKAEMRSALQLAIQQTISEELGALIDEELKKTDVFENVKDVASSALGNMLSSLKASMGATCQRFTSLAQSKLDSVDDKLKNIAAAGETGGSSAAPAQSDGGNVTPPDASRVAFLQVAIREKHKGFFDTIKKWARKGMKKVKAVGRTVKRGLKSMWGAIKPAVANGVRSAVAHIQAQVPSIIGQACERAETKLEKLESKVVPDDVSDDETI